MIVALIDNGSLEPAAHRHLRTVAAALAAKTAVQVAAVSWKHSDRIAPSALGGEPACTLAPWVRTQIARGEREFVFVPFFISPQGAIGSALRNDLEKIQRENPGHAEIQFTFPEGLAQRGAIAGIVADRVRESISSAQLPRPNVVVVDHGGPSAASAALRDSLSAQIRSLLGTDISLLAAASMEGAHPPLLADQLASPHFAHAEVVVAPLFLSPGRHAGPGGDLAEICRTAEARANGPRCHIAGLVGTHPGIIEPLVLALRATLSQLHVSSLA